MSLVYTNLVDLELGCSMISTYGAFCEGGTAGMIVISTVEVNKMFSIYNSTVLRLWYSFYNTGNLPNGVYNNNS